MHRTGIMPIIASTKTWQSLVPDPFRAQVRCEWHLVQSRVTSSWRPESEKQPSGLASLSCPSLGSSGVLVVVVVAFLVSQCRRSSHSRQQVLVVTGSDYRI